MTPARTRPAFPRLTLIAFGTLAITAALLSAALRTLREPPWFQLAAATVCLFSLIPTAGAVLRRDTADVQRIEARLRRLFTPPRRLSFTREGKYFIGITLGIGFAAINTGNNLLYLLLGMMLSLIDASGILSESSLRGLEVTRQLPARMQAGQPSLVGIGLKNGKGRLSSFSIEVEDLISGEALDKRCWFLKVPAGRAQKTAYRHQFTRRGRYHFTGFRLSTRFPFALFKKSRLVEAEADAIVLPRVHPIDRPPPPLRGFAGDEPHGIKARRGEFYGLREFHDGDDLRDVHWRSTARQGRLMVREHEDEEARRVTVVLDNALPGGGDCDSEPLLEALERAVSMVASLASHYLGRGFAVRVIARGEAMPWASGPAQLDRLLRSLAVLPTVTEEVPFAAPPERGIETLYVARRGATRPERGFGRVVEA